MLRKPPDLGALISRQRVFGDERVVVLRPGIALTLYSSADLPEVMAASADALDRFVSFLPPSAKLFTYEPPAEEGAPDSFTLFSPTAHQNLVEELRRGIIAAEDDGFGIALYSTNDGQAQDFGFQLGAIDFAADDSALDGDNKVGESTSETSLLRIELPWQLAHAAQADAVYSFFEEIAALFPFSSGMAGHSFLYTVGYTTAAREEVQRLCRRFIGFDTAYSSAQLSMRGRSPSPQWVNLIDGHQLQGLGGKAALESKLGACQTQTVRDGLAIRSARFPPIGDVNRGARDLGCTPLVARALAPMRMTAGDMVGLPDAEAGLAWLARFDMLEPTAWENDKTG